MLKSHVFHKNSFKKKILDFTCTLQLFYYDLSGLIVVHKRVNEMISISFWQIIVKITLNQLATNVLS